MSLLACLAFIGVRALFSSQRPIKKIDPVHWAVLAWAALNTLLWIFSDEKSLATPELRRVLLGAAAFFVFSLSGLTDAWQRRLLTAWSVAGTLMAIYGILQVTGGVGMVSVPQMPRVMGTFGNPIFFAAYLVATFFVTLEARRRTEKEALKNAWFVCAALQLVAVYFTQTRAAWVALAIVALFFLRKQKAVLLVVALLGSLFVYKTSAVWVRDQGHALIWRDTLRMAAAHPIKGVGLGAFHTNFQNYAQDDLKAKWPPGQVIINYAHNEYLQTLAEGGVITLLAFLSMFVFYFKSGPDGFLPLAVAGVLIQNFFSVDMRFNVSLAICMMLMGLSHSISTPIEEKWSSVQLPHTLRVWLGVMCLAGPVVLVPEILRPYRAEKAVSAMPNFFDQRLLDPAKSIQDLEKLAAEYPQESSILEKLAFVYAKEIKTPNGEIDSIVANKSIQAYLKVLRLDPKNAGAYNNIGNIHYTMGHVNDAIENWEAAVITKPDFLDPHLNLGKILYVQGRLKESAAHFEAVRKIDPNNSEAIVYLKRMVE